MTSSVAYFLSLLLKSRPSVRKGKVPPPKVCHLNLDAHAVGERSVFVIGDVHGCYDELCELMQNANSLDDNILCVFVGDLVNKGPKNLDVLRMVKDMTSAKAAYSVRGNHDEIVIREVLKTREDPEYELSNKHNWIKSLSVDDFNFLSELPYTISIPSLNSLIVHAAIVPGKPLKQQDLISLTNTRNVIERSDVFGFKGLEGTSKTDEGHSWAELWNGPEHVYFGHDARRKLQLQRFATGLDGGCVYGGFLYGVFINGCQQLLSVKARNVYKEP